MGKKTENHHKMKHKIPDIGRTLKLIVCRVGYVYFDDFCHSHVHKTWLLMIDLVRCRRVGELIDVPIVCFKHIGN